MRNQSQQLLLLHGIVFIWGFTGLLGKLIHLPADLIVWYRLIIAVVGLFIGIKLIGKSVSLPDRSILLKASIVGAFVGLHWITFYYSIQWSTASLGILCMATTSLHVTWLEPLILKRPFSWLQFLLSLVIISGIILVTGDFNTDEWKALAIGLASALCAAIFSVSNAKLAQICPAHNLSLIELSMAFLLLTLALGVQQKLSLEIFQITLSDLLWLLFLGLICTSFAFLVSVDLAKKLGPFTVSLTINLEPVYTIGLAALILHEHEKLNPLFYVGAGIIMLTVFCNSWLQRKFGTTQAPQ